MLIQNSSLKNYPNYSTAVKALNPRLWFNQVQMSFIRGNVVAVEGKERA
ncbi:hypothetical protein J4856_00550 [Prevotella scopos JCM 17725]|nr:hypothetical protein [Prevotella scopos]QUB44512.1 hypothetical protein J4856_00550 [Prevotella scopos JCM 17725]